VSETAKVKRRLPAWERQTFEELRLSGGDFARVTEDAGSIRLRLFDDSGGHTVELYEDDARALGDRLVAWADEQRDKRAEPGEKRGP
jgi:hypothetical protein